jgi:hypothetical protein
MNKKDLLHLAVICVLPLMMALGLLMLSLAQ